MLGTRRNAGRIIPLTLIGAALVLLFSFVGGADEARAATTWTARAGEFVPPEALEIQTFLPSDITVVEGDTIDWNIIGFHTVTFLSGGERPGFVGPLAGGNLGLIPQTAFPAGGPEYDGSGFVNSGLPPEPVEGEPPPPPFSLTFTSTGFFELVCLVHPGMKGSVTVLPAGSTAPASQEDLDATAATQLSGLMDQAQAVLARIDPPVRTLSDGSKEHHVVVGKDEDDIEYLRFLPGDRSIKVGDTVRWMARGGEAPHTVSFLSGADAPEFVLPEPQPAGPPLLVFNPVVLAPSGGNAYSGSGYFNSGLLLGRDGPPGAPTSYSLTFDTPGTFDYICLVHGPLMTGTITVSAALPSVGGFAPTPLMGVFAGLIGLGMVAGGGLLVARRVRTT